MFGIKIKNENNNEKIRVIVEHACEKDNPYWDASANQHNRVSVMNCNTRKRFSFDFWGSIREPNAEDKAGIIDAIYGYASDGLAFRNSRNFLDFCGEFGYDEDSRKAEKIYKACEKADERLSRIFGDDYGFLVDFDGEPFEELEEKGLVEVIKLD